MTTTQFRQRLLPDTSQSDLDLETLSDVHAFWRLQFGKVSRQQLGKDGSKVAVRRKRERWSGRGLHHGEMNVEATTYVLTFLHVVSSASRLYRSSSEMVPSILPLSLRTVDIIFLSAASFFSTLWTQARSSVAE